MKPDQLKNVRCDKCGEDDSNHDEPHFISARCHPADGVRVGYVKQKHCLRIACATCGKFVVEIEFDGKPHDPRSASFMNHLHDVGELADRLQVALRALEEMPNDSRVPAGVRAKMNAEIRHARELAGEMDTHIVEAIRYEGLERTSS